MQNQIKMDVKHAKKELDSMPSIIKMDVKAWQISIQKGGEQLKHYAELCSKIFHNKKLLTEAYTKCDERPIEVRLGRLFKHLDRTNSCLYQILETLRIIRDRTERMWRRTCLWLDDSCLREQCIIWELTASKLQEFLKFLYMRYDYEWEVKEMVVRE